MARAVLFPEIFYWFVFVYIIIIFLSPYLSALVSRLDRCEYRNFLIVSILVIVVFDFYYGYSSFGFTKGYSLLNGIFFYLVGAYINKFGLTSKINRLFALLLYLVLSMITGGLASVLAYLGKQEHAWNMFAYSSPFVIFASIAFFLTFAGIKKESYYKKIRIFSRRILAVYLFTEYWPMRDLIYYPINCVNFVPKVIAIFAWSIFLTFTISFCDNIRQWLFKIAGKR